MIGKILCRLLGHRPFEKTYLVIMTGQLAEEWERDEKKEYLGKRCPRCGEWEHRGANLWFNR